MAQGFAWRLSYYIVLDFLILWHYKERMKVIWKAVWDNVSTKYKFSIWAYLLLPLFAIGLEVVGVLPKLLTQFIIDPGETIDLMLRMPEFIEQML